MLSKFCNCTRLLKIKNNIYILWAFLIKQLYIPLALVRYGIIIANSALLASLNYYLAIE